MPFFLIIFSFLGIGCPAARAADLTDHLSGDAKVPWQISADTVEYDAANTTYHARGNVVIEKQKTRLVADRVAFNRQAMTASATGNVVMTVDNDVLTGNQIDLDMNHETGVLHDGSIFFNKTHFYIRGQCIEKTGKDTYRAERASVTSCDGDRPDWVITGRQVKVTVEGYGSANHALFKVRQVPVLYTPYILFPVKTKRQSGLLMPEMGYSDRKGVFWDQPIFWAINDSSDATVYVNPMEERGTKVGLEYRYALSDLSFGTIMADGLKDRRTDDGTEETERWAYDDDTYSRPNTDRYWLRAKIDQELPAGFSAYLDLDIVSDQDYLDDFKGGRSGYHRTLDYFESVFDRDLDTLEDNTRTNKLNINQTWSHYVFNADLLWNDNVVKRRWAEEDDTLQQLPVVMFNGLKQEVLDSGLYWDIDSEYTYFYREDGERGHRTDIHPRAYLPLRWNNFLSIEPSVGWRQTTWVMDRRTDDDLSRTSTREIYDFELDLSTEISKIMASPFGIADRIRHSIKPEVVYAYIPEQDQSDLPYFTSSDRIEEANRITYSLTNTFTARMARPAPPSSSPSPGADEPATAPPPSPTLPPQDAETVPSPETVPAFNYHRFCRFYLEQSYNIAAARENEREVLSDIYGELEIDLGRYLSVDADAEYDTYDTRFSAHNVEIRLKDNRGDQLSVEHRYKTRVNKSICGTLSVVLTDRLTVRGEYERNLMEEKDIVQGVGFLYQAQCWGMDVFFADEDGDLSVSVLINLMGVGNIGK
ncbi:LPS-assembly protein LptD [Desulfosarcina ovata]|uniref:LPS-assembly protein LptD n=1 Tax=Desulfosarcina ovata subsp. ovata TaxID=2752305 RepID=A0A5K8A9H4_9BACT|nr:LPS assembly protein LptD [Desulfosarcina ovata]BBO89353.1 LPS-assembly protein LptD [Desulfosarcina ovata subsp. ovata]